MQKTHVAAVWLVSFGIIAPCCWWHVARLDADEHAPSAISGPIEGKLAGQVRNDNGIRVPLVWVPPGKFTMGSPKTEIGRNFNEDQVRVTITKGFWIGQIEVTQSEWRRVMGTSPWKIAVGVEVEEGDDYPATLVSADDASAFCRRLSNDEWRAKRLPPTWEFKLPTEAQWEYACRAGTTTRYSFGSDESRLGLYAWYDQNTGRVGELYAHRVRQKKPNPWNIFDIHGNVLEWCRDTYADKLPGGSDPVVPLPGAERTQVGGCWTFGAGQCRSAFRTKSAPSDRSSFQGFRVVLVRKTVADGK